MTDKLSDYIPNGEYSAEDLLKISQRKIAWTIPNEKMDAAIKALCEKGLKLLSTHSFDRVGIVNGEITYTISDF